MSRYRPPQPKSSAYITVEGAAMLRAELHQLWKVERPQVTHTVHEAAKNGDRSENGDYIYGKRRLREIDSRVRYLTKRLEDLTIVDRIPEQKNKVFFGAWITVTYDNEQEQCYRIVGADELNPAKNWISMDSPLARAALGKCLDDEIYFQTSTGVQTVSITAIRYESTALQTNT